MGRAAPSSGYGLSFGQALLKIRRGEPGPLSAELSPPRVTYFWRCKDFLLKAGKNPFCVSHPEGHGHCAANLKPLQRTRPRYLVAKSFPGIVQAEQLQLRNKGIAGRLGSAGMQQPRGHFLSRLSKNIHSRQWAFLTNWFSALSKKCILISWPLLSSH